MKNRSRKVDEWSILKSEEGRIGYLVAWFLGVPSSVLLLIFLIRGH
jgi:hypothetical protein